MPTLLAFLTMGAVLATLIALFVNWRRVDDVARRKLEADSDFNALTMDTVLSGARFERRASA